jgi:actinin alpha
MTSYAASNKVDDATRDAYVAMQAKTFTRWVNIHLKKRNMPIEDIFEDTKNGVAWCNLCEIMGGETMKAVTGKSFNKKPKIQIQMTENGNFVLEYLKNKDMTFVNVGSMDFVNGNQKIVLGFIWKIILRFVVAEEGQDGLLLWAQRSTKPYSSCEVNNFHRSWKDGKAFVGIIHKHRPDLIANPDELGGNDAENLELAFSVAQDKLGIDRLLDVEDIVDSEKPDEKSIATYISQFYLLFAKQLQNEHYIQSILTAVAVTRRHDELIAKYADEASGLKTWIAGKSADLDTSIATTPANTAQARQMLTDFYAYRQTEKPQRNGELVELEGVLSSLHSSCSQNGRPKYSPASGQTPEELNLEFAAMEEKEHELEDILRKCLVTYQRIDFVVKKFNSRGDQMVSWTEAQRANFESTDFGNGVAGAEVALSNHEIYEDQLIKFQAVLSDLKGWNDECQQVPGHDQVGATAKNFVRYQQAIADTVPAGEAHKSAIQERLTLERELTDLKAKAAKAAALAVYDQQRIEEDIDEPVVEGSTEAIDELLTKLNGAVAESINQFRDNVAEIQSLNDTISARSGGRKSSVGARNAQELMESQGLADSLDQRRTARIAEMASLKSVEDEKEGLRKSFADIAKRVTANCSEKSKGIAALGGEPQEKMDALQALAVAHHDETIMSEAETASNALSTANILINPYTNETIFSLRTAWNAVSEAYKQAMDVCEQLIMDEKGSKLTSEQIKEVREVFDYFDIDKDNTLDNKEFRDACQGIGLLMDDDEVNSLFIKVCGGKKMNFERFSEFMYDQLKTGASLEDVMNAFRNLAGGADFITSDAVGQHFAPHGDVSGYLLENMGTTGEGLDYNGFTIQLFTR